MPRKVRLSIAGALHHVMARGIEGRNIFNDDEDRQYFLALLSEGISVSGFRCYAWVLMENHYHLLLRVNEHSLSVFMRQLNSKYARWFRKKVPQPRIPFSRPFQVDRYSRSRIY